MTHPDQSEQQLRRALRTMNDLKPPTDELFVQRAVIRGRARTNRRRNALLAVAAALVVVAGGGGGWLLQGGLPGAETASPASAPEVMGDQGSPSGDGSAAGGSAGREQPTPSNGPDNVPVPPSQVGSDWFVGPLTAQRTAVERLAPELTTRWGAVFSGAYATDPTNTSIVVALTRPDDTLEDRIRSAMPDPEDVEFARSEHSYADKAALVQRIRADSPALAREGIAILTVTQDPRADRVAVAASGSDAEARLQERYGADWVTVTLLPKGPNDTFSTPPPR